MTTETKEVTYAVENNDVDRDEDESHVWKSACLRMDKNMIVYLAQFLTTLLILTFCAFMLAKSEFDCNKSSPYIGLISFILGKLLATISTTH